MKCNDLIKHLRRNGCYLKREGASHSLWSNPKDMQSTINKRNWITSEFARGLVNYSDKDVAN